MRFIKGGWRQRCSAHSFSRLSLNSTLHKLPSPPSQDNFKKAMDQIKNGDNVVFLANHQSEADPQVLSILLESIGYSKEAADIFFVAGHKVRTDPLAIPFSMGRNLLCIHSKKHMEADKESLPMKQRENLMAMSAMLEMLKIGGHCLWVAPSGGRDRRNVETGGVPVAEFDRKTVDMFRLMATKSKKPCHFYPMAMVSLDGGADVSCDIQHFTNLFFTPPNSTGKLRIVPTSRHSRRLSRRTPKRPLHPSRNLRR